MIGKSSPGKTASPGKEANEDFVWLRKNVVRFSENPRPGVSWALTKGGKLAD